MPTRAADGLTPTILAIDHIQLAMPAGGESEARRFYGGALGLREVPKPPTLAARGGCWFASVDGRVHLHLGVDADFRPAAKAHVAFVVHDLGDARRRLSDGGAEVVEDASIPEIRRFYTSDPFGNRIELVAHEDSGFSTRHYETAANNVRRNRRGGRSVTVVDKVKAVEQLHQLGVRPGMVLVVHTSFRRVAPVDGGPTGLIEALTEALGPTGTLVMPTMTGSRSLTPFDPSITPSRGMGVTAERFRRLESVLRSGHPTSSFAARGPQAEGITAPQPLEPAHGPDSPIGRVADYGGWVLLLGVGHDANTTIHLAEYLAGVPYRVRKWTTLEIDGQAPPDEYEEIDHCCRNFELVGAWLDDRGLQRHGTVGHAEARLVRARDILGVTVPFLRADPLRFLCLPDAGCQDCDLARASVDGS